MNIDNRLQCICITYTINYNSHLHIVQFLYSAPIQFAEKILINIWREIHTVYIVLYIVCAYFGFNFSLFFC